jgi:hypothetical protein
MITDPWIVFSQENGWPRRVENLDKPLQSSLVTSCVDHALAPLAFPDPGLLADARQALWEAESEVWLARLEAYAIRLDESPKPGDPPLRAIDALVYAISAQTGGEFDPLEALFSAFWAMAGTICPSEGWIEEQYGRSGLMEELEAQVAACPQAYHELVFQEVVLRHLEADPIPLTRQGAALLADLPAPNETARAEFAREIYQAALDTLSSTQNLEKSYLRTLLHLAEFEKEQGQAEHAAELERLAQAEIRRWEKHK